MIFEKLLHLVEKFYNFNYLKNNFFSKGVNVMEDEIMNTELDFETIDMLSKGITQFAFRSGPVEEMHARGKLTQKDMKTLNKYMVNLIAGLLTTISNGDIANVLKVLTFYASLSINWDIVKPDSKEFYL